jgi:cobalt-zinc-cadmium efflux system outer membrane protein
VLDTIEKDMLIQAQEVREISQYSYTRGEATLVEFLDAQRAFNETMHAFNEARAAYARSLYLIDAVVGAGGRP